MITSHEGLEGASITMLRRVKNRDAQRGQRGTICIATAESVTVNFERLLGITWSGETMWEDFNRDVSVNMNDVRVGKAHRQSTQDLWDAIGRA